MPDTKDRRGLNTAETEMKRTQYRAILAQLAQLSDGDEASRVQNCNKRETLRLIDVIRGEEMPQSVHDTGGWLYLETAVASAMSRPATETPDEAVASSRAAAETPDEAVVSLGHLFYLAGAQMTSVLDATLETLLKVLQNPAAPERRRVLTIKAIGEICWCSAPSQERLFAQGGVQPLVECVYNFAQNAVLARWACYTLTVVLADSAEIWQHLRKLEALERTLKALAADAELWTGWDNNHAAILCGLLYGLHPGVQ
ncbi:uncharacterized protein LOC119095225 [Pollicipes pollicipes]|uniref:uncharacterized protein LOC119095225 n=1 Tax=Pollicipes pollicipes TaxID=41117 RepID=UPI0018855E99|nr:uncharacterized protein LOC119095225 [Pollicipes pollicipes]